MPVESSNSAGRGGLWQRVSAAWRTKAAYALILPVLFCVPYFTLQHYTIRQPRNLPLSFIDRAVPFQPAWVWAYQSIYLLINLLPWLGRSRDDMTRYLRGFLLITSISFLCFLLFPITGPRPQAIPANPMYRLLVSYDGSLNSFPSLHAGLVIYTAFFATHVIRGPGARFPCGFLAVWVILILYGTLATKEHYAVDLFAGGALAVLIDWYVWRGASAIMLSPPEMPLRERF